MTADREIEGALELWFTEGPTSMPSRFFDDTLDRIDRAPRPRLAGLRAGLPVMHPHLRSVVVAAAIVVVVGVGLLVRSGDVWTTPVAGSGLLPTSGTSAWRSVGPRVHPTPSGVDRPTTGLDIVFGPTAVTIFEWHGDVHNSASVVGADRIDLRMLDDPEVSWPKDGRTVLVPVWPCHIGDAGTYTFSLSSGGRRLTLTPVDDACAARATILAGDWVPQDSADIPAGRYDSPVFRPFGGGVSGRLAFTVPTGWTDSDGQATSFMLRPGAAPQGSDLGEGGTGIWVLSDAVPSSHAAGCDDLGIGVARTPVSMAAWLRTLPGLVVTAPTPISIGGLSGVMVDVSVDPGWQSPCPLGGTNVPLDTFRGLAPEGQLVRLIGASRARYILLDGGDGSAMVIDIQAPDEATWQTLIADAMPIVQHFEFTR